MHTKIPCRFSNQYNDRLIQRLGYKYTDSFLPVEADYDRFNTIEIEQELSALIHHEWNGEANKVQEVLSALGVGADCIWQDEG